MPPQVVTLIQRCLEKDRRARIGDIAVARFLLSEHGSSSGATAAPPSSSAAVRPVRVRWSHVLPWGIVLVLGLLAAAFAMTLGRRDAVPAASQVHFTISLPDNTSLLWTQGMTMPVVSPDGRHVAFIAARAGTEQVWVRSLATLEARPLAGTDDPTDLFWSPDSRLIGFTKGGKIQTVGVEGGPLHVVCPTPTFSRGSAWNRDGIIIYGSLAGGIFKVAASGGQPAPVTTPDAEHGESAHRVPSFLPDGRHFLYLAFPSNAIWIGSLDGEAPTRVMTADSQAQYAPPGYLLFARDGVLLAQPFDADRRLLSGDAVTVAQNPVEDASGTAAFSASESGVVVTRTGIPGRITQLTWVDRGGRTLGTLAAPGRYRNPVLSPDDARVAVELLNPGARTQDIWILRAGQAEGTRFTFDNKNDIWPAWSPDGSRLAFGSDRQEGKANLYTKPSNGSAGEQLLLEVGAETLAAPLSWSPDGKLLVFRRFAPYSNMGVLRVDGDRSAAMFQQVAATQAQGQISPNGRWLAYHSNEGGSTQVYVQSFPEPGAKWQISREGGLYPRWRKDGNELYYYAPDGYLMGATIGGDVVFESGVPRALFQPGLLNGPVVNIGFRAQYDVARDGRFLLNLPVGDAPSSPITVVMNWAAGLNERGK